MQKFSMGDLVQVADDLGQMMRHFTSGCRAIVIGSYSDQFGGSDTKSYTLYLEGKGECSWYDEHQLTLIEKNRCDLLEKWKQESDGRKKKQSSLDWIFENGPMLATGFMPGASISTLAACLGCDNMWGRNGEGITWYTNALAALSHAKPFLTTGDRAGWEKYCEEYKASNNKG